MHHALDQRQSSSLAKIGHVDTTVVFRCPTYHTIRIPPRSRQVLRVNGCAPTRALVEVQGTGGGPGLERPVEEGRTYDGFDQLEAGFCADVFEVQGAWPGWHP